MSQEEVLDKYKVEDSKREACKGRGARWWRRVRKSKTYRKRKGREDCWPRIFALFREYNLQRLPSKQEESTEGEEMKQQQIMKIMKGCDEDQKVEWTLKKSMGGSLSCWRQIAKKHGLIQEEQTPCRNGMIGWRNRKKEDEKKNVEELHQQK